MYWRQDMFGGQFGLSERVRVESSLDQMTLLVGLGFMFGCALSVVFALEVSSLLCENIGITVNTSVTLGSDSDVETLVALCRIFNQLKMHLEDLFINS